MSLACACAATGEPPDEDPKWRDEAHDDAGDETLSDADLARCRPTRWPDCEQRVDTSGTIAHPFLWEHDVWPEQDHPCRFGCTLTAEQPKAFAPGMAMKLHDDGGISVYSNLPGGRWSLVVPPEGLVPTVVRWTSWCGPNIVITAHDRRRVRVIALSSATGAIVDRYEQAIRPDRQVDEAFDVQMHCYEQFAAIHARGTTAAWSLDAPRPRGAGIPRAVPAEIFARLAQPPSTERPPAVEYEVERTTTRAYHRNGAQLFALDLDGRPLWHAVGGRGPYGIGCLTPAQTDGLVGWSRHSAPTQSLEVIGEHALLEVDHDMSATDVFDAAGQHLVHISNH